MVYILIPLLIWLISQTIKYLVRVFRGEKMTLGNAVWDFVWAGGPPSTHSALLTAGLYLIAREYGFGAIFGFAFVVALLRMFDLVAEWKKEVLFEEYLKKDPDKGIKKMIREGRLLDASGHRLYEVVLGIVTGLILVHTLSEYLLY